MPEFYRVKKIENHQEQQIYYSTNNSFNFDKIHFRDTILVSDINLFPKQTIFNLDFVAKLILSQKN